jgi:hypothetical protein
VDKENLEVILEEMSGKMDVFLEGQAALINEVRELSRRIKEGFKRGCQESHL